MPKQNRGLQVKRRKDRGTWEVGEYFSGKWKRHAGGFESHAAAEDEKDRLKRERRTGHIFELGERMIGDALADYTDEKGENILSVNTHAQAVKELVTFWGGKPLSYITEGTCNAYYAHRDRLWKANKRNKEGKTITNGAVGRELRILRAAVNRDFDMGRIVRKPKVFIRQEVYREKNIITRKEALQLARVCRQKYAPSGHLRFYVLIALYTGARKKAILDLRWPQVDFKRNVIDFRPPGYTGNKKYAVVPMHRRLRTFMKILRQRGTDMGYVLHINQKKIGNVKDGFMRNAKRIKLDIRGPYDLRHASIVHMLQSNISVFDVAQYHGTSVEMIEKNYAQYKPEHLKKASESWG